MLSYFKIIPIYLFVMFCFPIWASDYFFSAQSDIVYSNEKHELNQWNGGLLIPFYTPANNTMFVFGILNTEQSYYGVNYNLLGLGYRKGFQHSSFGTALGYMVFNKENSLLLNEAYAGYFYTEYIRSNFFLKFNMVLPQKIYKTFIYNKVKYKKAIYPLLNEEVGIDYKRFSFFAFLSQNNIHWFSNNTVDFIEGAGIHIYFFQFFNTISLNVNFTTSYGSRQGMDFLSGIHIGFNTSDNEDKPYLRYFNTIPVTDNFVMAWTS